MLKVSRKFPTFFKFKFSNILIVYFVGLAANLGGTEIYNPLEQIFQKPPIDGYLRQVFVLTDGEASYKNLSKKN